MQAAPPASPPLLLSCASPPPCLPIKDAKFLRSPGTGGASCSRPQPGRDRVGFLGYRNREASPRRSCAWPLAAERSRCGRALGDAPGRRLQCALAGRSESRTAVRRARSRLGGDSGDRGCRPSPAALRSRGRMGTPRPRDGSAPARPSPEVLQRPHQGLHGQSPGRDLEKHQGQAVGR